MIIARNHFQREGQTVDPNPQPLDDHIAFKIEDWDTDKVKAELDRRGLKPRLDTVRQTPVMLATRSPIPMDSISKLAAIRNAAIGCTRSIESTQRQQ